MQRLGYIFCLLGMIWDSLSPAAECDMVRKLSHAPCPDIFRVDPVGVDTPQPASVTQCPLHLSADRLPCEALPHSSAGINRVIWSMAMFQVSSLEQVRAQTFLEAQDGCPKPMG